MMLQAFYAVVSIYVPPLMEKVSMYADDTLLHLGDARKSLTAALEIIYVFGRFSGIKLNWDKSVLFSLTHATPPADLPASLQWVDKFKYLSILIQKDLSKYMEDNVCPVFQNLLRRCVIWKSLLLTPVGRVNLIKMSFLPKFLYVFRHTPICMPNFFLANWTRPSALLSGRALSPE